MYVTLNTINGVVMARAINRLQDYIIQNKCKINK